MRLPRRLAQWGTKVASEGCIDPSESAFAMRTLMKLHLPALALLSALAGCAGTAMTIDPGSGALVPVQGWKSAAWHDDPAWRAFGPIGKDDFRPGPWWYGDPSWQFLSVGQGGIVSNRRGFVDSAAQSPAAAAPEAAPTEAEKQ